jgi:hypothetical protein
MAAVVVANAGCRRGAPLLATGPESSRSQDWSNTTGSGDHAPISSDAGADRLREAAAGDGERVGADAIAENWFDRSDVGPERELPCGVWLTVND